MSDTVNITINGQVVHARMGQSVLQAAEAAGIDIPTLCNHPHLRPTGSCRVCLVEIEKQRMLQPSCTFPVTEGMVVRTETDKVVEARKFSLQMLFSERNHYCMFCASSGTPETTECELQKLAYRYGLDCFQYPPAWQKQWPVDASRKSFTMDHSRCILCRRCIRACDEIAANHTLGVFQRGAKTMICADDSTSFGQSTCVECGTCLQACPTGALMDKRSSFVGHPSECRTVSVTCVGCAVACGLKAMVRGNTVLRLDGDWDEHNAGLLCVKGRFESLRRPEKRITKPMIRRDGELVEVGWDEAITYTAGKFKEAQSTAGMISPRFTNETMIAMGAFLNEVLHSDQVTLLHGLVPPLDLEPRAQLKDLEDATCIVIVGEDVLQGQKVLGYLTKRAYDRQASVVVVDDHDTAMDDYATERLHLDAMSRHGPSPFAALKFTYHLSLDGISRLRKILETSERPVVMYGPALSTLVYAALRSLPPHVKFLPLATGSNACGAAQYGIEMREVAADALFVMAGDEPSNGFVLPQANFTVVQAVGHTELTEKADVVLPARLWTEKRGTILNIEGRERPVVELTEAPEGIGPDWMPLAMMAAVLGRPGLFASMAQVQNSL